MHSENVISPMIFGQETVILKLHWKPDGLQVQPQTSILAENRVGSKYLQSASGHCCERALHYIIQNILRMI